MKSSIDKVGREDGMFMGLSAIFLDRDALFRAELARQGTADPYGRVMLRDWELGLAVNHARQTRSELESRNGGGKYENSLRRAA